MEITNRPRRLRTTPILRKMVKETTINKSSIVYPIFIIEGNNIKEEIQSMPEQYRYSIDRLPEILIEIANLGISSVIFFGIPNIKDEQGSGAWAKDGIVQKAFIKAKKEVPELYYIGDVCMCEYTSHGHCGILKGDYVDNDKTLDFISEIALSQVQAGADMVAPSDMMDGRVKAIRNKLDKNGFINTPIMSYSAKYSSAFYGPFRNAANSAPAFGDRQSYQMDYHNRKEAIKEVLYDIDEGADIIMIKPAMSYLDIIRETANIVKVPVAAYSVSGEYSMIKVAAKMGYVDEQKLICETTTSIYRAGASILLTYFAKELAHFIDEQKI